MYRFAANAILVLVPAAAILLALSGLSLDATPPARSAPPWQMTALPGGAQGDFDLRFHLAGDAAGAARVAFDLADNGRNYRFLDLAADGVRLGAGENGAEYVLARQSSSRSLTDAALVLRRREETVDLLADGALLLRAYAPARRRGAVGIAGRDGLSIAAAHVQPVAPVFFSDDFMREADEPSQWETVAGTWAVNGKANPIRSSNPFNFYGRGDPFAAAVVGYDFWSDYHYRVACKTGKAAAVGIYFCYHDARNYYLFRWTARRDKAPVKELIRCVDGERRVVWSGPGGFLPEQWYELWVETRAGVARVGIDDTAVCTVRDDHLARGRIGLYVEGAQGAEFDDVQVRAATDIPDALGPGMDTRWLVVRGDWQPGAQNAAGRSIRLGSDSAAILRGVGSEGHRLTADVAPDAGTPVRLLLGYRDDANYAFFEFAAGTARIWQVRDGERRLLAERRDVTLTSDEVLSAELRGDHVRATAGDATLEAVVDPPGGGVMGIATGPGVGAVVHRVEVDALPALPALPAIPETFAHEKTMAVWAGALSDLIFAPSWDGEGHRARNWWRRGDFRGDVKLELKLPPPGKTSQRLHLYAAGAGDKPDQAYDLAVAVEQRDGKPHYALQLRRRGEAVAAAEVGDGLEARSAALVRSGSVVHAELDGETRLRFHDAQPLTGTRIGWGLPEDGPAATAAGTPPVLPVIYADDVESYTFGHAPVDWRVASGEWEVTNRWECDPRWSFFSGRNEDLAAIWNKRILRGDVSVDFYCGPKMDRARGGRYEYASDLNVTLCGDGKNMTSGYAFVFGGNGNTVTRIYRNGLVVAESANVRIETGNLHRRWYHVGARKEGGRITLAIDGQRVLTYDDAEPLPDGQMAIWTWNNGIMAARVGVSAAAIGPRESPDVAAPPSCASLYDRR